MTSLEEKISKLKTQILSSQVQSTLLRSSSFKLQINLNVLYLDMKYVTNFSKKRQIFRFEPSFIRRMSYADLKGKIYHREWDREKLHDAVIFPLTILLAFRDVFFQGGNFLQKYRYCRAAKTGGETRSGEIRVFEIFIDHFYFPGFQTFWPPSVSNQCASFVFRWDETFFDYNSNFGCHSSCNSYP